MTTGEQYDREVEKQVREFVEKIKEDKTRDERSGIRPVKAPSDVTPDGKLTDEEIILTDPGMFHQLYMYMYSIYSDRVEVGSTPNIYVVDFSRNLKPVSTVLWPDFDWCRNKWEKPRVASFQSTHIPLGGKVNEYVLRRCILTAIPSRTILSD